MTNGVAETGGKAEVPAIQQRAPIRWIGALLLWLNADKLRTRILVRPRAVEIHCIAVLPLQNLSNDPEQDYFSDGMTDELMTDLANIGRLQVISHTSVQKYKGTKLTLPEIA